jgi:Leucine-rich repeat (LRR) protein
MAKYPLTLKFLFLIICGLMLGSHPRMAQAAATKSDLAARTYDCSTQSEIPLAECQSLVDLYNATGGDDWYDSLSWLGEMTPCEWSRVTCQDGHVVQLSLSSNNLTGSIPASLKDLEYLTVLNLNSNHLSGLLPPEIGQMGALTSLRLNNNSLSGAVPADLGLLTQLTYLDLSTNTFSGNLPPEIGNLTALTDLILHHNGFSGALPPEIGSLTNLTNLRLNNNQFSGALPAAIGNLTALEDLYLTENQISGAIPPEIGNLSSLVVLNLGYNQFSGPIPAEIGQLTHVEWMMLDHNALTGVFPEEISSISALRALYVNNNEIYGPLLDYIEDLPYLSTLNAENNHFSGSLDFSTGKFPNLSSLYLSENIFSGAIPDNIRNLTHLIELDLCNNPLSGQIPQGLATLSNLRSIEICHTYIGGDLPANWADLEYLTLLNLSYNQFSGSIPESLGELERLEILQLDHNVFTGSIPGTLSRLDNLTNLNLSSNMLTGRIPAELNNLTGLQTFYLNVNKLSGPLPISFSALSQLRHFSAARNDLNGSIPLNVVYAPHMIDFDVSQTYLCEPETEAFNTWKAGLSIFGGSNILCSQRKEWLLLYYLAGDNSLSDEVNRRIQVLASQATEYVDIAIFVDDASDTARVIEITTDGMRTTPLEQQDSGDAYYALQIFISLAQVSHRANNTALIIFGEGNGLSGVAGDDDPAGSYLTPAELKRELNYNATINVLYQETSYMANFEAAYQLRGAIDYYVASQSRAWVANDFAAYIPGINSTTSPADLANAMASAYFNDLSPSGLPVSISVVDMAKIPAAASRLSLLAANILAQRESLSPQVWNLLQSGAVQRFDDSNNGVYDEADSLVDAYHLAEQAGTIPELLDASERVTGALYSCVIANYTQNGSFSERSHTYTWDMSNAHGLSIALPQERALFYTGDWLDFADGADWTSTIADTTSTLSWGRMVSDLVMRNNPDAASLTLPPALVSPLLTHTVSIFLPGILR